MNHKCKKKLEGISTEVKPTSHFPNRSKGKEYY